MNAAGKPENGHITTQWRPTQRSASAGDGTAVPPERRIPLSDIETARRMRRYFEEQIRPVTLVRRLGRLRDEIASKGPSDEREKRRIPLILPLMIYRGQANYDRMKARHGVVSEDLEYMYTRPLTDADRQHIKEAWKLHKEIAALLGYQPRKRKKQSG